MPVETHMLRTIRCDGMGCSEYVFTDSRSPGSSDHGFKFYALTREEGTARCVLCPKCVPTLERVLFAFTWERG